MTVQDFIIAYNAGFKFIRERHGDDAVRALWQTISDEWCLHLRELVTEQGIDGLMAYWGGDSGTLQREKAAFELALKDGVFSGVMHECPSVAEIRHQGFEPMKGSLSYCDHCPALYAPVTAAHGIRMTWEIEYGPNGGCTGRCSWTGKAENTGTGQ
jgi:hypothetical protein